MSSEYKADEHALFLMSAVFGLRDHAKNAPGELSRRPILLVADMLCAAAETLGAVEYAEKE